ncbi:MAG: hypothetical protein MJZ24_07665 [Paludibacteraceae bacterium]|nr:hypothetical protein [Candidatus Physcocola equi]MCQ2234592.1 hypothetical protein [Paludibacteraceae bacterium]
MIYKFIVKSPDVNKFRREIEINQDDLFLDLSNVILSSCDYTKDQITSFFLLDEEYERQQEISLEEMDTSSEQDSFLMADTHLDELVEEEGQILEYVFDILSDRSFLIELKEIKPGSVDAPTCTKKVGTAPKQIDDDFLSNDILNIDKKGGNFDLDEDFNSDGFDDEDKDLYGMNEDIDPYADYQ